MSPQTPSDEDAAYSDAWLVQIREDGECAFTYFDLAKKRDTNGWLISGPHGSFRKDGHFNLGNLAELKDSMQTALVKAGLFPDEASAMLL